MNIKTKTILFFKSRWLLVAALSFFLIFAVATPLFAQTVLQGYKSDQQLQRGMLVALNDSDSSKVETITNDSVKKLKGVVADANDSPVTLSDGERRIFVATTGTYEVLVSNENGKINQGDYLSGSSLDGIAMKANDTQPVVVGRAVDKFEGGGDSVGKTKTKDGETVEFARIKVDLGVGDNPWQREPEKDKVPDALQKAANSVADKDVSALRIYLALAVLLVTASVAAVTLFSGVRSTIIAIGRNPLSKGIIFRGLIQVLLLSLIIFISGLFGVYLLIKL
jgi:hypothetical protein